MSGTPLTEAAKHHCQDDVGKHVSHVDSYFARQLERRAIAAEKKLAESDAIIKQVQREWLGGKYGVMQFAEGVSARINDAENAKDEYERTEPLKPSRAKWVTVTVDGAYRNSTTLHKYDVVEILKDRVPENPMSGNGTLKSGTLIHKVDEVEELTYPVLMEWRGASRSGTVVRCLFWSENHGFFLDGVEQEKPTAKIVPATDPAWHKIKGAVQLNFE